MQGVTHYNETELTNEEKIEQLERLLESRGPQEPDCQVLVKLKVNGGVPVKISYVTQHAL